MKYLVFYCPACRHTTAVPAEQVRPGPVYCGRCRQERGQKVRVRRDLTAEGVAALDVGLGRT